MTEQREPRALVIASMLLTFGLGAVFGALASRILPKPRVVLAPGLPEQPEDVGIEEPDTVLASDDLPDSIPGNGTASAPDDYPIKGNERSGIYHRPGGFAYERTVASRYFRSVEAAEAAGFRPAKS